MEGLERGEKELHRVRLIGLGRAGRSLMSALQDVGWLVVGTRVHGDSLADAAEGVDALVISTPDDEVARVAAEVTPVPSTVVLHLSGSLGLGVLAPHPRRAAMHPLAPLPSPEIGARRLRSGGVFAVTGDPLVSEMARALGGRPVEVTDANRSIYHAAACVASNHLVALLGQVERLARAVGLELDDYLDLASAALEDVRALGPAAALTGPAARGDVRTLQRHRQALFSAGLGTADLAAYDACAELARSLAQAGIPVDVSSEMPACR